MKTHSNGSKVPAGTARLHGMLLLLLLVCLHASAAVRLERLPEPGLQPQAITASDGSVHVIYLRGEPAKADVVYRRKIASARDWDTPIQVNSQPGSAIAVGTIRGAQFALGRDGRVHVIWNGSSVAEPRPAEGGVPLLYARLEPGAKSFSEQRNLLKGSHELDGGGSIAADAQGRVFAIWHASPTGKHGETNRTVFMAISEDDGARFGSERVISPPGSGACGCCGLTADARDGQALSILFRTARSVMDRGMSLLVPADTRLLEFREVLTDPWSVGVCPMSSASLFATRATTWAAWETAGQIRVSSFRDQGPTSRIQSLGHPSRTAKHPRIAVNSRGEVMLVWTEGTAWAKGGDLSWQVLDSNGTPVADSGRREGLIPAWSYAAVFPQQDDSFLILY